MTLLPQMKTSLIAAVLAIVLFGSCSEKQEEITLIYSINEPMGTIALTVRDVLEEELGIKVNTRIGHGSLSDLKELQEGSAELTLAENYLEYMDDIRTLVPLYPQLFHVLYKSDQDLADLKDIVKGKTVYMGYATEASYQFIIDILAFFDVPEGSYTIQDNPFDVDVLIGFTDIIKPEYLRTLKGYRIFSLDKVEKLGNGSKVDAINLVYPKIRPFIIPQQTYSQYTDQSILTIYDDIILMTNKNLDQDLAYRITKALFTNSQRFNDISPLINRGFNENFNRMELNAPLHEGARIYLDRDEPSYLERYAEVIGLTFSILIALISGIFTLSKVVGQKKKDRIDVFYEDLLKIRNAIPDMKTLQEVRNGLVKIKNYRKEAFHLLVDEKLKANESFRIYMELSKETSEELTNKYKLLKRKQEVPTLAGY